MSPPAINWPSRKNITPVSCPYHISQCDSYSNIERSYALIYDISTHMSGCNWLPPPSRLLEVSPDSVLVAILHKFAFVTEAEKYATYAQTLATWLTTFHSINPEMTEKQVVSLERTKRQWRINSVLDQVSKVQTQQQAGVVDGNLDTFGFPTMTISDSDSVDSIGTERFGSLHWRVARIHADLLDLPYSFVELIDLHILLIYVECVLTGELFDNMTSLDAQMVGVRVRFDLDCQQPEIIAMLARLQAILDDDDFQHLSTITDDQLLFTMEAQSNVETEFSTDEDGFPVKSTESKHEQYVDSVEDLVIHLTMLKMLSEKRKVRNFTKKAKIRVEELKEAIANFDAIDTLESEASEKGEVTSSPDTNTDDQRHTLTSDAVSTEDAQKEFMENTTDINGSSPPKVAKDTIGFVKHTYDMYGVQSQRPNRNSKASAKLGNTNVAFTAVEDYSPSPKKDEEEFFTF